MSTRDGFCHLQCLHEHLAMMASIAAPVTIGPSTPSPFLHRSFTLPPKLPDAQRSRSYDKEADRSAIETLFAHRSGRIVSFISGGQSSGSRSGSLARAGEENGSVGILPWASVTEKTLAAGKSSYEIYARSFAESQTCQDLLAFIELRTTIIVLFSAPVRRCRLFSPSRNSGV